MKAAALLVIASLAFPPASNACSCIVPPGSEKTQFTREFKQAEAVFLGYVYAEVIRKVSDNPAYSKEERQTRARIGVEQERFVRVRVLQVWKGSLNTETWIEMYADDGGGGGCGYPAQVDSAYIVFSHPEDSYAMSTCSFSGPVHSTSRFIPLLNRLAKREQTGR